MNEKNQKLARKLFDVGAVKFGAFKLKLHETQPNASLSPIYLNLRTASNLKPGPLSPLVVDQIALSLYQLATDHALDFTHVVGVPRAGDPFAESLVVMSEYIRKKPLCLIHLNKEEGELKRQVGDQIFGSYKRGDKVLLVDDLITKASSKLEAIIPLIKVGLEIAGVVVLVDREQGGAQQLREAGYTLLSAFTLSELLDFYLEIGYIDQQKRREVADYLAANS